MCKTLYLQDLCARQRCNKRLGDPKFLGYKHCTKLRRKTDPKKCKYFNSEEFEVDYTRKRYCSLACVGLDLGDVYHIANQLREDVQRLREIQEEQMETTLQLSRKAYSLENQIVDVLAKAGGVADESEDESGDESEEEQGGGTSAGGQPVSDDQTMPDYE
ncbi:hypothetical protein F5B20DRAFT_580176 [Whalleya microplaca]|nr:hypothetical protein F5B20DRAFT_580176 [Whalleya microplaca]